MALTPAQRRRKAGLPQDDPRHGTTNGYFNYGCRCEPCRIAGNKSTRDTRQFRKTVVLPPSDRRHGTTHGYVEWSCRCARCKRAYRDLRIEVRFGLDPKAYDALLKAQGGCCAICGKKPGRREPYLSVDHDPKCCPKFKTCGRCVRGLLCRACNLGIGHLGHDLQRLESAITYLSHVGSRATKPQPA